MEHTPPEDSGSSMLKRALRMAGSDAARYLPVRFIPALTSLITVPLFTSAIAEADYGAFYLINSITTLGAAVGTAWLSSSAIRFYWPAKREGRLDAYTSTVLWSALAGLVSVAAVVGVGAVIARDSIGATVMRLVPIAIAYFVLNYLVTVLMQVLRAANRASAFARLSIVTTLLCTALSIVFVVPLKWGAAGIFAGVGLGSAIMLPFVLSALRNEGHLGPRNVDRSLVREFLSYGMPLVPVGISSWILVLIDRFIIEWAHGTAQVGLYSVAYGLGEKIMALLTMPLILTITPMLTQTFENQGQELAEKMQTQFTRYFLMATIPLVAGLAVVAEDFMRVFTGRDYYVAYPVLSVIAGGVMLSSLAQIAGTGLGLHKRSKLIMLNTLTAAGFNVIANVALVPRFGYMIAAYNTMAAYGLLLVLTWWRSKSFMRWHLPTAAVARIIVASAGMAALVWLIFSWAEPSVWILLAEGLTGLAIYVVLLRMIGGIRPDEAAYVREMAGRARDRLTGGRGAA
jgi:O-antigen/teichoic acid export membrane protein